MKLVSVSKLYTVFIQMYMAKFNTLYNKISNSMSNCDSDAPGKNKQRPQKK